MNFIDIIILIILLFGLIKGIIRGFILQLFSLLGIILGIYIAKMYIGTITFLIMQLIDIEEMYAKPLAYLIIFCVIILVSHLIAKLLDNTIKISLFKWLNSLLGGILGLVKYALVLSILLNVFQVIDSKERIIKQKEKNSSSLYKPVLNLVPTLMPSIDTDFLENN